MIINKSAVLGCRLLKNGVVISGLIKKYRKINNHSTGHNDCRQNGQDI